MSKISQTNSYKFISMYINETIFAISFWATFASMALSQIYELEPCTMCWYQRIFMFPIPIIAAVAIIRKDKYAYLYMLPIAVIGWLISFYHNLLQWGVIVHETDTCSINSVSCSEPQIQILGIFTIPFGSLLIFSAVIILSIIAMKKNRIKIEKSNQEKFIKLFAVSAVVAAIGLLIVNLFIN